MSGLLAAAAAIVWLGALYQASIVWRGGGDVGTRWHVVGFAALGVALSVNTPPIYRAVDRITGIPNFAELLAHASALVAAWCAHAAIVAALHSFTGFRRRVTPSAIALALTLVAMTGFFFAAPVNGQVMDFTVTYAGAPFIAQYFLAYLAFAAFALADIGWLGWRYRRPRVCSVSGCGSSCWAPLAALCTSARKPRTSC